MTIIDNTPREMSVSIRRTDGSEEVVLVTAMPWVYRQQLCLDTITGEGTTELVYLPLANIKDWKVVG